MKINYRSEIINNLIIKEIKKIELKSNKLYDNLRLANQLFETSKKLENTKEQINKFESNKSQIQQQIYNLNETISKNNVVKDQINLFAQNKDIQNISKISIEEKPNIELDISSQDLEEKNKELEEVNEKTKNIFANKI